MPAPDSIAAMLLGNLIAQAAGYFVVVGVVFLVVWRWGRERFKGSRIQPVRRFNAAQLRREIFYTLVTFVVGTATAGTLVVMHGRGLTRIVDGPVAPWIVVAWVLGSLAFNDLWFYAWHRLLHTRTLFRLVHSVHHKSVDVNPFSSYSFHAAEGFILGAWVVPAGIFLPMPVVAIGVLQVIGLTNNVMSHLGYEFLPRWLLKVPLLRLTNTATFHSLHHTRLEGNYGLHTRLWDRLFSTEIPEYEATFLARGSDHTAS